MIDIVPEFDSLAQQFAFEFFEFVIAGIEYPAQLYLPGAFFIGTSVFKMIQFFLCLQERFPCVFPELLPIFYDFEARRI